jgi:hypothetical protein
MHTTPTPDAVLAALWETDFDLPQAAKALLLPLTLLLRLLKNPEFAGPLDDLHELSKQCLDLRAARTLARSLELLDAGFDKTKDPAEHRRLATAVTKAANATARFTRPAPVRRAVAGRTSDRPIPDHALPGFPAGRPAELEQPYRAMVDAWAALRSDSCPATQEGFARAYNEWTAARSLYLARHPEFSPHLAAA